MKVENKLNWLKRTMLVLFLLCGMQASSVFGQTEALQQLFDNQKNAADAINQMFGKSGGKQQYEKAKFAVESAAPTIIGKVSKSETDNLVVLISQDANYKTKFEAGLTENDAKVWLGNWISEPKMSDKRAKIINKAFWEVYGRGSIATEQAVWDAKIKSKQAFYAVMVNQEKLKLAQNYAEIKLVIGRAYQKALGRNPTKQEELTNPSISYAYSQLVGNLRDYLYSAAGATELVETISRAYQTKNNRKPSDDQIKKLLTAYSKTKAIYAEMIFEIRLN